MPTKQTAVGLKKTDNTLTRGDFLRLAGAGTLSAANLGASGCRSNAGERPAMNIVLVILDSLRKDHLGAYGNRRIKTPNLDALAAGSLRFTRAYPESAPTICARRAIHTGMRTFPFKDRPSRQKKAMVYGWLPIPAGQPTLAEILEAKGYRTALITDTYHQFSMNFGRGFGVYRKVRGQERDPYKDPSPVSQGEMQRYLAPSEWAEKKTRQYLANTRGRRVEEDWFAPKVFLHAAAALEELSRRGPFFMVVDCFDPHEPWDPPEKYTRLYDPDGYEGRDMLYPEYGEDDYLTYLQLERMRALYSAEITMVDHWLGHFLEKLEELDLFENTFILVISDHGIALGEHGITGKPHYALWPEITDVPFMIRHPEGKLAGETSDFYASTHDVAPTVLGVLGARTPSQMEGQDLSMLLDGKEPEPRRHFTLGYHNHVWTRDENHVMFSRNDGTEARLYDVRSDPQQTKNISAENPDTVGEMFEEYVLKDAGGSLPTY